MEFSLDMPELHALLLRVIDGQAADEEIAGLREALADNEQVQWIYLEFIASEASLAAQVRAKRGDQRTQAGDLVDFEKFLNPPVVEVLAIPPSEPSPRGLGRGVVAKVANLTARAIHWHLHPIRFLTVIAMLTVTMWALWLLIIQPGERPLAAERQSSSPRAVDSHVPTVARLIRTVRATWEDRDRQPFDGMYLRRERTLQLATGLAEIQFHDGALVILEGPAEFSVTDPNGGHLETGKLVAHVKTPKAHGFQIETPNATVIDLGTEFGIDSDRHTSRVRVFNGQVNVNARGSHEQVVLVAGESARVAFSDASSKRHIVRSPSAGNAERQFVRNLPERPPVGIAWTAEPFTSTHQIINEGSQVVAMNLGGPQVMMNGVHFMPGNFGQPLHIPACYDSSLHSIVGLTAAQADELLDHVNFGPGVNNSLIPQNSISGLSGLAIGESYVIQALLSDQRSSPRYYDFGHGSSEIYTLRKIDIGRGPVLCTGRFTAHAATQAVHIQFHLIRQFNYTVSAWQLRVATSPETLEGR